MVRQRQQKFEGNMEYTTGKLKQSFDNDKSQNKEQRSAIVGKSAFPAIII